ncbi:hypothetical protein ACFV1H_18885 [Streptomyces virginiae]|uniref:hypothetical protein n=1 Tax=Streptomyces virginiae TaxID=1961 RepID=UPI0036B27759
MTLKVDLPSGQRSLGQSPGASVGGLLADHGQHVDVEIILQSVLVLVVRCSVGYGLDALPHLGGIRTYLLRLPALALLPVATPVLRMWSSWQ